jgi:outer membrane lipoprotein-sorting protein
MRILAASVALVAITSCTDDKPVGPQLADAKVMTAILDAQTARTRQIRDFSIAGTATSGDEVVKFTLAFQQPGKLRSTLDDGNAQVTLVFDGKSLLAVDETHKVAQQKDLSALPEDQQLMVVMQGFGRLFCEGWRTPLLSPKKTRPAIIDNREALVVALDDDTVKEERYFFVPGTHDFDGRSTLDKAGKEVAFLRVLDRVTEAGMLFPSRWEKKDAMGHSTFALTETKVNQGVDAALFSTAVPAGVTLSQ